MKPVTRIVLKLSGEILSGPSGVFDETGFKFLLDEVKSINDTGVKLSMVIGGGNIYRGRTEIFDRVSGDTIGMLSTIINAVAVKDYFDHHGIKSKLFTPFLISKIGEVFTAEKAITSLESGNINLYAGGTGHPFFSTDTLAILRGLEIHADYVLKATKVSGVFDSDPVENPEAEKFDRISYTEIITRGFKHIIDYPALTLAQENGLEIVVFNLFKSGNLKKILSGDFGLGTVISS